MYDRRRKYFYALISFILILSMFITYIPVKVNAAATATGGPIILMGIDAEDGGPGGHGPISVYQNIVNSILAKVTNGGSGILVFGANSNYVTSFWNAIGTGTGQTVKFVDEASIGSLSFTGYAMLAISSDEMNTNGGLTQSQHNKLVTRQNDIASFINTGGGLLGFASDFTNPYAYLGAVGKISANINQGYSDITPNAEGRAIGITDDLDVCCWHDEYTAYPDFLEVLATSPTGNAAVIGGLEIAVPSKLIAAPSTVSIAQGQSIPLNITLDDGITLKNVTSTSTGTVYSSSSPNVVVDNDGVLHLLPEAQVGDTALIQVTHGGNTTTINVKVDLPVNVVELLSLDTNKEVLLGQGEKLQLSVNAIYSDGSKKDVTFASMGTTYESDAPDSVYVSPNGLITIADNAPFGGFANITVKNQDKTAVVKAKISDPPSKLIVNPDAITLKNEGTQQLTVTAEYADGTKKDVTKSVSYTSENTSLAIVNNSGLVMIPKTAQDGQVIIHSTYAGLVSDTLITVSTVREFTGLQISPDQLTIKQGESQSVKVTASYSDGSTEDVTSKTTFSSADSNLATVDHHGVISVPASSKGGSVDITGNFNGKSVVMKVTVPPLPTLTSLKMIPSTIELKRNQTEQLQVIAEYSDGSIKDVTSQATYESTNESLATVDSSGLVTVKGDAAGGSLYIRSTFGGKGTAATVTVPAPPPLAELKFSIDKQTVTKGDTAQVKVDAVYSDGTVLDVTSQAGLTSSLPGAATVDPATGVVTVIDNTTGGTVYIRGSFGGKGGAASFTIPAAPTVTELKFSIDKQTVSKGETAQVKVEAVYTDGTVSDVTSQAGLTSSLPGQATVDPATGVVIVIDNTTGGTVYIRGSFGGKGGAASFTIPAAPYVTSLTFSPAEKVVKPGDSVQLQVLAIYSDGRVEDVTVQASLKSNNNSLAVVEPTTGMVDVPLSAPNGKVEIQGSFGGKSGAAVLTVSKPYLVGISFTPDKVTLKAGETLQMQVNAIYSDGSIEDVTAQTSFTSSNENLAVVDTAGLVTVLKPTTGGSLYIRGTYGGKGAASTVTIPAPLSVTSLKFTPASATLKNGQSLQLNVIAEYSDGSTEDVTSLVTYTTSNANLATVDKNGLITVLQNASPGTVYIRGSYGGKGGATTITVPAKPTVQSLTFNPIKVTLSKGSTFNVQIIANYSDGSTEDVTSLATWTTSNAGIATVDSNGLISVPLNSTGGTVYIRGSYGGKGGATTVTVPK